MKRFVVICLAVVVFGLCSCSTTNAQTPVREALRTLTPTPTVIPTAMVTPVEEASCSKPKYGQEVVIEGDTRMVTNLGTDGTPEFIFHKGEETVKYEFKADGMLLYEEAKTIIFPYDQTGSPYLVAWSATMLGDYYPASKIFRWNCFPWDPPQ
jgi:hypothetical protein